ncbi:hypothetical protein SCALM49S_04911 [Streptomyces californicus]
MQRDGPAELGPDRRRDEMRRRALRHHALGDPPGHRGLVVAKCQTALCSEVVDPPGRARHCLSREARDRTSFSFGPRCSLDMRHPSTHRRPPRHRGRCAGIGANACPGSNPALHLRGTRSIPRERRTGPGGEAHLPDGARKGRQGGAWHGECVGGASRRRPNSDGPVRVWPTVRLWPDIDAVFRAAPALPSHRGRAGAARRPGGPGSATPGTGRSVVVAAVKNAAGLCQGRMLFRRALPVHPLLRHCRGSMSRSGVLAHPVRRLSTACGGGDALVGGVEQYRRELRHRRRRRKQRRGARGPPRGLPTAVGRPGSALGGR